MPIQTRDIYVHKDGVWVMMVIPHLIAVLVTLIIPGISAADVPLGAIESFRAAQGEVKEEAEQLAGLAPLSHAELDTLRGGFNFAGMDFSMGVNLRTSIDGVLAAESVLRLTGKGVVEERFLSDPVTQVGGNSITHSGTGGMPISDLAESAGINIAGLNDTAKGLVSSGTNGMTLVANQISNRQIIGIVANRADDRIVNYQVTVDVTVKNFTQFQDFVRNTIISQRILD